MAVNLLVLKSDLFMKKIRRLNPVSHLLLDLSIGCLHNYLLPSRSGGSGVLLHSLLLSQPLETRHVQYETTDVTLRFLEIYCKCTCNLIDRPEKNKVFSTAV